MKFFLDNFTIYNDMDIHLQKLKLCFQKCKEFGISMNLDKCVFMVFSGIILRFIVSKKGKLPNLKKIQAIVQMRVSTKEMAQFY
jgi:HKD family nuclease